MYGRLEGYESKVVANVVIPCILKGDYQKAFDDMVKTELDDFDRNGVAIGDSTFNIITFMKQVYGIDLLAHVDHIPERAFAHCERMCKAIIPGNVDAIEYRAFAGCTNMSYVEIQNGVKEIDAEAFDSCYSLYDVVLPTSIERIGEEAFYGCKHVTFMYDGSRDEFVNIDGIDNIPEDSRIVFRVQTSGETVKEIKAKKDADKEARMDDILSHLDDEFPDPEREIYDTLNKPFKADASIK